MPMCDLRSYVCSVDRSSSLPSSVRVERSRDTPKACATDGHLDFARCERERGIPILQPRVPAKAGTHLRSVQTGTHRRWAPAFAGARAELDDGTTSQTSLARHRRLARTQIGRAHV